MISAELLMTLGGASAFLLTVIWVRGRDLREKYAVLWIGVATMLLVVGLFPSAVMLFADAAHLSYPAAVLFPALTAIYLFAFSISVSLTRQYRRNARLMQEMAILEMRLKKLEGASEPRSVSEPRPMKITLTQWNVLANLAGQASYAVLTFFITPIFLALLGVEAYGIVGVFSTAQSLLVVLDLGISAAANRELALLSGENASAAAMRATVRRLEIIYWLMAFTLGIGLALLAPVLADWWLQPENITRADLIFVLRLMALALCLHWPAVFYASCLTGLQRHAALNLAALAASMIRLPLTALLLYTWAPTLAIYFLGQGIASLVHTLSTAGATRHYLPAGAADHAAPQVHWDRLRRYASGFFRTALLAMGLASLDKLILAHLVTLDVLGAYMLSFTLASGLGMISNPIYLAVFPRFTQLAAAGAREDLAALYHHAAQLLSVLLFPIAVPLIFFPASALLVWTGNAEIAANAANVLRLLVLATTLLSIQVIPTALQYAHGWMQLSFVYNLIAGLVYAPICYLLADRLGGEGAAFALVCLNASYILFLIPLMHRRLLCNEILHWYANDILLPLTPTIVVCGMFAARFAPTGRLEALGLLTAEWCVSVIAGGLATPVTRRWLWLHFKEIASRLRG